MELPCNINMSENVHGLSSRPFHEPENNIVHPFAVPASPLSQDSQDGQQSSPFACSPHSNSKLHSSITIDHEQLSTQRQSNHAATRIYNICSISQLPCEITHLIVQFLQMNETDAFHSQCKMEINNTNIDAKR